jgi:hypothetical protein
MIYQHAPHPHRIEGNRCAIGSGFDVAMGVLELGHDAIKAVEICSVVCNGVGGGVDALHLRG